MRIVLIGMLFLLSFGAPLPMENEEFFVGSGYDSIDGLVVYTFYSPREKGFLHGFVLQYCFDRIIYADYGKGKFRFDSGIRKVDDFYSTYPNGYYQYYSASDFVKMLQTGTRKLPNGKVKKISPAIIKSANMLGPRFVNGTNREKMEILRKIVEEKKSWWIFDDCWWCGFYCFFCPKIR